jgi:hypothetical protein
VFAAHPQRANRPPLRLERIAEFLPKCSNPAVSFQNLAARLFQRYDTDIDEEGE